MAINSFRNLRIWQEAHRLSLEIYRVTASFPAEEKFGIISQMRRAATSVSANISEGSGRHTRNDYVNFLYIARGSAKEIINFCLLSIDLGWLKKEDGEKIIYHYDGLVVGIQNYISAIKNRPNKTTKHL
jgi:four helix bundle protein